MSLLSGKTKPCAAFPFSAKGAAFLRETGLEVRTDWPLYAFIGLYLLTAVVLEAVTESEHKLVPFLYMGKWLGGFLAILGAMFVFRHLGPALAARRTRPFARAMGSAARCLTPRFVAGCLLLCALPVFYGTFTSIKNMLPELSSGYTWDLSLANLDARLHGGIDPWRLLRPVLAHEPITRVIEWLYFFVWFALMLAVSAWVAISDRCAHLRLRFFATFFLCWSLLGNVLAGLFLSAGPAFYGRITGDGGRFAQLTDFLASLGDRYLATENYQRTLWHLYERGQVELATGISAFPSLHLAIAMLCTLFLWSISRVLGLFGVLFIVLIQLGSVHLGWHYAIDGYFSILATLLLWLAMGDRHRHVPAAGAPGQDRSNRRHVRRIRMGPRTGTDSGGGPGAVMAPSTHRTK